MIGRREWDLIYFEVNLVFIHAESAPRPTGVLAMCASNATQSWQRGPPWHQRKNFDLEWESGQTHSTAYNDSN
jgi:hypothetical protein